MTRAQAISTSTAPEARAEALIAAFERAGYARVAPAILQPAEPFLDLSGEDIRKRMYLTTDPQGRELCLRPDLTIPVSRDYLASPSAGKPRGFCYLGPVFRHRLEGGGEFLQAGIESFGREDTAAADAEMLALGLDATAWKRRLIKDFNHKTSLAQDLDRLTIGAANARPEYQGVLAALAGADPKGAHALVTDLLSIAGITAVGGRSVSEIADHFLEQAALGGQASLPRQTRALIEKFLAVAGDPREAAAKLHAFAREAKISLKPALDLFESRTRALSARGVDVSRIHFSTAFGRGLDYYTGVIFELHDPRTQANGPLVAGGRYDGLLTRLGSARAISAVGFAVWIERLAALRGKP